MTKYIDAELIRKEIEKKSHEEQGFSSGDSEYGYHSCARDLLAFIDSLQQEQPDDLASLISEATNVAKRIIDRDSFYNLLPQNIRNKYTFKAWCEILETLSAIKGQEQPEVDLEEEYKTWWNSISGKINVEHMMEWYMHETARHFYELGKNNK